jgi:hypothetical protein
MINHISTPLKLVEGMRDIDTLLQGDHSSGTLIA